MNKKLIAALFAGAFAFASASAMADDKTAPIPVDQAKLKAERDAAKAKWAGMTAEQKAATRKAVREKKIGELTELEMVAGQESDSNTATPAETAKLKSERAEAKAKFDKMTPEEKAAMKKAAQAKKLSELSVVEKISVGQ
jgi:cell division protein FtsL